MVQSQVIFIISAAASRAQYGLFLLNTDTHSFSVVAFIYNIDLKRSISFFF